MTVSVKPKQNRLLFDRLIPHLRRKWSSFDVYKKADTLSLCGVQVPRSGVKSRERRGGEEKGGVGLFMYIFVSGLVFSASYLSLRRKIQPII